jgi:putative aldouronate transport system substrate-binding protein
VHINYQEVSMMSQSEQFNLMVASNDYPDIIQGFGENYTKGIDNAIDEDIITDLTDILADYAPYYSYLRDTNAEIEKSTTTDTGRVGSFYFLIGDADLGPRQGLWIRQDWLEALNLDVPTTYDELHDVLLAFHENYNTSDTLLMTQYGYFSNATLLGGYDVGVGFYNQDGVIKYGPIEDGFRDYMIMMNQWYSEGLISSDFSTLTDMTLMMDPSKIINDSCGVWNANYRGDDSWKNSASDPNFTPLAIADMTKTGTEQIHVGGRGSNVNRAGCVVSADCEDPETATAWIDWWYSDDATMLSSYGIQGETFEYNEDGQPLYTDLILNNDAGSARAMRNIYTGMSFSFRVYRVVTSSYDSGYDILDRGTWDSNRDNEWDISDFIARTAEEGDEYSTKMSDIETYVEENLPKFLNGSRPLSEWDDYVQDIKNMGIDDVIAIETACVERYEAR